MIKSYTFFFLFYKRYVWTGSYYPFTSQSLSLHSVSHTDSLSLLIYVWSLQLVPSLVHLHKSHAGCKHSSYSLPLRCRYSELEIVKPHSRFVASSLLLGNFFFLFYLKNNLCLRNLGFIFIYLSLTLSLLFSYLCVLLL